LIDINSSKSLLGFTR